MSTIKKIFYKEIDEEVHSDFLKFGRGEYPDKYLVECKKQASKWAIKTSAEFANFFVRKCLEKVSESVMIKGIIVSTLDIEKDCDFEFEVKKAMGIRKIVVNSEIGKDKILNLMEKYPKVFFALTFSTGNCDLKIKAKAPKSSKPGSKTKDGEGPKADFCSLKTTDVNLVRELLFGVDFNSAKEVKINHTIVIEDVIYPKDESNPEKVREMSKRKGKIIRKINVDGREEIKEAEFEG